MNKEPLRVNLPHDQLTKPLSVLV